MNFLPPPCEQVPLSSSPAKSSKGHEAGILVATILGSSMAFIDGTVVNVALPALQNAFHTSVSQIQWIIEAYSLFLASLLLVGGALGDLYGRRFIFLIGVFVFTVASVWCGLSFTIYHLIIARAVQGVGAALLVPGSLALITASFPEERRGKAIGTWAGFTAITTAIGPVLGGWLVQNASWRWIFFMNVPLAIIVVIVTMLCVTESESKSSSRNLDITGALLVTIGLGAIVFGLLEWQSGERVFVLSEVIGICALIGFFFVEFYKKSPMMPLNMFRSYDFSGTNLITFFLYFALYGVLFFFPLDLIQVQGYTATEAGAALFPFILLMFILSRWAGGLVKQFGSRAPLVVGPAIAAVGFALFLHSNANGPYWTTFFPAVLVLGFGMAVSVAPLTTVVMNSAPAELVGTASGVNNAISRMAGLLAIAILGLVMTMVFNQHLISGAKTFPIDIQYELINQQSQLGNIKIQNDEAQQLVRNSFIAGYDAVLWIAVALALCSSLSAFIFINRNQ